MNICTLLDMIASGRDTVAFQDEGSAATAAELLAAAGRGARWLRERDASAVVYVGTNSLAMPTALFAAAWAGIPFVPLNFRLADEQLRELAGRHKGAVVLGPGGARASGDGLEVVTPDEWDAVVAGGDEAERWEDEEDDLCIVLYTSGTTGSPKGVLLRHRHLTSYVLSAVEFLGAGEEEATLVSVPPYHIAGIANLLSNLYAGRRVVYLPAFSAEAWLATATREQVTHAMVVPTMLARIVDHLGSAGEAAPPSIRAISYGGAKTPAPVIAAALEHFAGVGFVNAYGLTETSSTIALLGPEDHDGARTGDPIAVRRLSSVGKILPGVEVGVFGPDGGLLPAGEVGEVKVRGPQVSGEYDAGSVLDEEGWFATRDLGWVDGDGYLFIEGRGDDTIIRGGENIAPAEIETVLLEHPAVADVGVVGIPDAEWGQVVAAAVVLRQPGVTEAELKAWSLERLRSSKAPSSIRIVEELPYSELGKLVRRHLVAVFDQVATEH
jgi:acyl-CoA synthetase (AMP-forming)/AMP-acid ligase II